MHSDTNAAAETCTIMKPELTPASSTRNRGRPDYVSHMSEYMPEFLGKLDDQQFALELLENKHVLVAPGSSFNTPYTDHFRITSLPDSDTSSTPDENGIQWDTPGQRDWFRNF